MKVLWVTNTVFPDMAKAIGQRAPVVGGWMYGLAQDLANSKNIDLFVATARGVTTDEEQTINNITYFLLKGSVPINKYDSLLEEKWRNIIAKVKPDVIHIHGTEYAHGLSLMNVHPNLNYIVSIQGLISVCARYYMAGLKTTDALLSTTFKDLIKRNTLWHETKEFYKRGSSIEVKYIEKAKHIIGRTQWDYDHTKVVNPDRNYHFCNESLRDSFYTQQIWEPKAAHETPTIFLSQASKPLKGLHKVIEALHLLRDIHPNINLRIAGGNIVSAKNWKQKLKRSSYGNYIRRLLKKYGLQDRIKFTGPLDEKEMVNEYLNSHMFVCPSSIENSPNSLGEAQLLGVPVIASYVGGVSDMVEHGETGLLYRFEEVEMLAMAIHNILSDPSLALKLSRQGQEAAKKRHDRKTNLAQLISIYNSCKS
jgi:glycosyltransferase involved in cell wall biosynthesis